MRLNLKQLGKIRTAQSSYQYSVANNKKIAFDLFNAGQYQKASEHFTALIKEENSTDPQVLAAQAICICQQPARFAEAEALSKRASFIGNEATEFQLQQGHVLREIGKADLAVKLLTNLLKREPRNWEAHYQIGWSLNRNWTRYSAGILHLNESIKANPDHLDSYYWRGEAYYWLDTSPVKGDPFEWLQLVKDKDSIRKKFYQGLAAYQKKDYQASVGFFESAEASWKNWDHHDLDSWRGEAYLATNQLDKALSSFELALTKNPRDALSLHGKGEVLKRQGKDKEGSEAQLKALEVDRLYYKQDYFRVKEPIQKGV